MPKQVSSRAFAISQANLPPDGMYDLGPAATSHGVGTFVIQFVPDGAWVGQIAVLGRCFGVGAQDVDAQPMAIPYRRVNVAGAASDYAIVSDTITQPGIIQVPANGLSVILAVSCEAGSCAVTSWDLMGPSAI